MIAAPADRAERLAAAVAEAGLDMAVIGDLVRPGDSHRDAMADVSWLTGFTGSSGLAVVGAEAREFLTDFRYSAGAAETVPDGFRIVEANVDSVRYASDSGWVRNFGGVAQLWISGPKIEWREDGRRVVTPLGRPAPRQECAASIRRVSSNLDDPRPDDM